MARARIISNDELKTVFNVWFKLERSGCKMSLYQLSKQFGYDYATLWATLNRHKQEILDDNELSELNYYLHRNNIGKRYGTRGKFNYLKCIRFKEQIANVANMSANKDNKLLITRAQLRLIHSEIVRLGEMFDEVINHD